jgi:DNA polymerase-3 subunit delta
MTYEQITDSIRKKIYHPVYFLTGEEPYYIDKISKLIEKTVLNDAEKEFNQMIVYGRDVASDQVLALAKEYPVFSNYRVVIVREAQDLKQIEKDELLKGYLRKPVKSTILVFDYKYKKIDGRTEFAKLLDQAGVLFQSKKMYDNQVPAWIETQINSHGLRLSQNARMLLSESLGNDLSKIENEINKLIINLPKGSEVTPDIIEQNIGISKDYNVFELQKALGDRNIEKCNRIVKYFGANPKDNSAVMVTVILFGYFRKLFLYHFLADKSENNVAAQLGIRPFLVREYKMAAEKYPPKKLRMIFSILREYDRKAKGVESATIEDGELLQEMVFKILH